MMGSYKKKSSQFGLLFIAESHQKEVQKITKKSFNGGISRRLFHQAKDTWCLGLI